MRFRNMIFINKESEKAEQMKLPMWLRGRAIHS